MMKTLLILLLTFSVASVAQAQSDNFRLIRNATFTIEYAGHKILVDPMFAPKNSTESVFGKLKNPLVDLPAPIRDIVENVDLILLTHTHFDHFDMEAVKHLDKSLKFVNQPADRDTIQKLGFKNAETLTTSIQWQNIKITPTNAQHGTGSVLELMGNVTGFILEAENHPTVYIVGDAVWTEEIYRNIKKFQPDYIIVNTGGARLPKLELTPIIMDETQAMSLIQESGKAKVIAIHMDALDHCKTTREVLKKEAKKYKIDHNKLIVPEDGEIILIR